jgi:hypothetical protein
MVKSSWDAEKLATQSGCCVAAGFKGGMCSVGAVGPEAEQGGSEADRTGMRPLITATKCRRPGGHRSVKHDDDMVLGTGSCSIVCLTFRFIP